MGRTSSTVKDRYNKKAYDEIKLRVPKGEKEQIRQRAIEKRGDESINGYIVELIHEDMKKPAPSE